MIGCNFTATAAASQAIGAEVGQAWQAKLQLLQQDRTAIEEAQKAAWERYTKDD